MRYCSGLRIVDPALELAAVERPVAWTKCGEILLGNMVLQHGRGGHDFENRSWRKLRLNRAIEQRFLPVFVEILPVAPRDTHGEIVGVQSGIAGHCQNFACARIRRYYVAGSRPTTFLRKLLQG